MKFRNFRSLQIQKLKRYEKTNGTLRTRKWFNFVCIMVKYTENPHNRDFYYDFQARVGTFFGVKKFLIQSMTEYPRNTFKTFQVIKHINSRGRMTPQSEIKNIEKIPPGGPLKRILIWLT